MEHRIVRSRRRTVALIINPDATLTVRAPLRAPLWFIARFIGENSAWITRKIAETKRLARLRERRFEPGEKFLFLGRTFELRIDAGADDVVLADQLVLPEKFRLAARPALTDWYRRQAAGIFGERLELQARRLGYRYRSLRISGARRRWGSCGAGGSINLSWRLVMAPIQVIDYVVVHELVHIEVHNHSRRFWNKVAAACPAFRAHRRWLNAHGRKMDL